MLADRPNPHDDPPARELDPDRYRHQAREIARRLRCRFDPQPPENLESLGRRISLALAREAEGELRQAINVARGRIELALSRQDPDEETAWIELVGSHLEILDRLEVIVETYLDQDHAHAQAIEIDPEPFDLGCALAQRFAKDDTPMGPRPGHFDLGPAPVRADKGKLVEVLWSLIERFHDEAVGKQHLVGHLRWEDQEIQGYVGVAPGGPSLEVLLDALGRPLDLAEARIDEPFIRAVIELHGGRLYVAEERDGRGYRFRLPALASF